MRRRMIKRGICLIACIVHFLIAGLIILCILLGMFFTPQFVQWIIPHRQWFTYFEIFLFLACCIGWLVLKLDLDKIFPEQEQSEFTKLEVNFVRVVLVAFLAVPILSFFAGYAFVLLDINLSELDFLSFLNPQLPCMMCGNLACGLLAYFAYKYYSTCKSDCREPLPFDPDNAETLLNRKTKRP